MKNGTGESIYYYEFNVQGDIIGIIDSTGTKVVEYTYSAWGDLLSVTGTLADTIGQRNPLRYRGYYYDAETGFYYLTSRYYDAEIGRFVNADNAISGTGESVQGYNLFAYCFNNPVKMSDETGHWPYVFVAKVLMVTAIVTTTVNHIINAKNKNKINKEVKKTYTKKTAKKEIDGILKEYGKDIKVAFNENSVEIKNSAKVNSRYDRQKISTIITRTEELTERSCGNLSAEWFFHNVAYDMHIKRSSAISADLEYTKDKRKIVSVPTGLLEIFGWE